MVEHWNSTGCNLRSSNTVEGAGATAAGGEQRVSILPLDQWTPTSLTMRMRITSKRANFDGEWATRVVTRRLHVCVCAQRGSIYSSAEKETLGSAAGPLSLRHICAA